MSDYSEIKKLAEAARIGDKPASTPIAELIGAADSFRAAANPAAVLELIAEIEEMKAVFAQPESLTATPFPEYDGLKRQFFALRTFALCKDKLAGYYSRELEKLRCVDRSQASGEIDAERSINEQLTNDLLTVEDERDAYKTEIDEDKMHFRAMGSALEGVIAERDQLKAENERQAAQFKEWQASYHANYVNVAEERKELKAECEGLRRHAPHPDIIWCDCGDGHHANSYGAGFMAANGGVCENCDAANGGVEPDLDTLRKDADKWQIVERAMTQLQSDEQGAAIWSACSRILISVASELNSGRSVVTEQDVTKDGVEIGDWRVTVERIDAAMSKGEQS